jgi:hypothetical protein
MTRTNTTTRQRPQARQQGGQLAKPERGTNWLQGNYRSAREVNQRLASANSRAHLVAPATAVGALPEGTAIALNVVTVDARDMKEGGEIYSPGGGRWALARSVLNRIAAAAGVSWDAQLSGRIDDGSDPKYCHFRSVGWYRSFDGTDLQITGEKEMDLRDGSPQLVNKSEKQIRELRFHILAHAESKAKNRAIRSLGLKPTYSKTELEKPFVAAKLVWTGQSDDPELKRLFAEGTMQRMLGGSRALFGPAAPAAAPTQRQLKTPPPVSATPAARHDDCGPGDYIDAPLPPASDEGVIDAHGEPAQQARPPSNRGGSFAIPGGREKGTALAEASDSTLEWWRNKIATDLDNGTTKEQFRAKDEALLEAMEAELARRQGAPELPPGAVAPEDEPEWPDDEERY